MFPELTRRLALDGAEVLAFPTNSPRLVPPEGPWPMEVAVAATTAYVNRVFVAVADRCGSERGVEWVGAAWLLAPAAGCWPARLIAPAARPRWPPSAGWTRPATSAGASETTCSATAAAMCWAASE